MPSPATVDAPGEAGRPPLWHTLGLVAFLLLVAAAGISSSGESSGLSVPKWGPYGRIVGAYLPAIAVNVMLAAYVGRIGRKQPAWRELMGKEWATPARALGDLGLAVVAAALIVVVELGWAAVLGAPNREWVNALLPATLLERMVWVLVAVAVGGGEELVYRGYLRRELAALSRSPALGIAAQAGLFGVAHGEQGAGAVVRCFVYGVGLGILASRRGSLVPGVLAHAGLDVLAGIRATFPP